MGLVQQYLGNVNGETIATRAAAYLIQALLVAFVAVRATSSGRPAMAPAGSDASLVFGLFGRIWPLAVPAKFFCLAILSLGIAIGRTPPVEDLVNNMAIDLNYADENVTALENITDSSLFDNLASAAPVDRSQACLEGPATDAPRGTRQ